MQSPLRISWTCSSCHRSPSPRSTKKISSSARWQCAGVDHLPGSTSIRVTPTPTLPAARPRLRQLPPMWPSSPRRGSTSSQFATPPLQKLKLLMEDTPFHAARDCDHLTRDLSEDVVGCEGDDLASHILVGVHLSEGHSPGDARYVMGVARCPCHGRLRTAGSYGVLPSPGTNTEDLLHQAQEQSVHYLLLLRVIVCMAGLAEQARGRADEDQAAVTALRHTAQEAARREERDRQVGAQRRLPTREGKLPDGRVVRRPDPRDGDADVERPGLGEQPISLGFVAEISCQHRGAAELLAERAGAVLPAVVVDHHFGALVVKGARGRRPDPAGRARDEHALTAEAR